MLNGRRGPGNNIGYGGPDGSIPPFCVFVATSMFIIFMATHFTD